MIDKFKLNYTPREEVYKRIEKLQELLCKTGIQAALIVQKANLFYFSGTCQEAHLFVPNQGKPILMVKKNFDRALIESPLENVTAVMSFKEIGSIIAANLEHSHSPIGLELDVIPYNLYVKYQEILKSLKIVDISMDLRKIRMIKTPYELEIIKEAARVSKEVFSEIPNFIKEGMTEIELAAKIEMTLRMKGHQGFVRVRAFNQEGTAHILSGWAAAYPSFFDGATGGIGMGASFPQGPSYKKIERHEPVVVDFATVINGYVFDQTRIFSIGKLSDKLLQAHGIALEIKKKIIKEAKPGANGKELYKTALNMAESAGLGRYFMGYGNNSVSFIGHGVGLELDELPLIAKNIDITLEEGMVFALEPKFVFPGEGAIGIEDTLVLTKKGIEKLNELDDAVMEL